MSYRSVIDVVGKLLDFPREERGPDRESSPIAGPPNLQSDNVIPVFFMGFNSLNYPKFEVTRIRIGFKFV